MKKYYQIENYGYGFITHIDNETAHVAGYPKNIWVTDNIIWAERVNAVEITKEAAQIIVNSEVAALHPPTNSTTPVLTLP